MFTFQEVTTRFGVNPKLLSPPGAEAWSPVVFAKPERSRLQPGAGDDPPAHLQTPAQVHPVRGGFWLHCVAHAVASHQADQSDAPHLPAVQRHALQVTRKHH